ncbi:uncharacterized protein ASCRUDRAFT_31749 [Ascoidea rubescens DSM 1968]|uniref:S-adenosyl-L-methionine-dependent methyltransferase n=1 Tax=Ascoidea rubescens DSM 1968 TaxID=1344418 RepID=A0A1D2VMJ7_9ASCO|nr:hypothetical protein ASCRUDRAFT_31749 [Ascoidea rubescens DSM 1968]ODV62830.1 hypothetical protein ASCRUDRAFT_31749 [Ascoidea rubescens DSM 1968]
MIFGGKNDRTEDQVEIQCHDQLEDAIIRISDLPSLSTKPPGCILITVLKLLFSTDHCNFSDMEENSDSDVDSDMDNNDNFQDQFLENYNVSQEELHDLYKYLTLFGSQFGLLLLNYREKLLSIKDIPKLFRHEFFDFITSILANDLNWIENLALKEEILQLSSKLISENCGRLAKSDFIRRIKIKYDNGGKKHLNILLQEPSLTEDKIGLKTWGSSLNLSRRICNEFEDLIEFPVLELGSGTGLIGIVLSFLMKSQNKKVNRGDLVLTDLEEIVDNLKENVKLNQVENFSMVKTLNWESPDSFKKWMIKNYSTSNYYQTIIISDCLYSPSMPFLLIEMIKTFFKFNNTLKSRLLIQNPVREGFEYERNTLSGLLNQDEILKTRLKLVRTTTEYGYDDFGRQEFIFQEFCS